MSKNFKIYGNAHNVINKTAALDILIPLGLIAAAIAVIIIYRSKQKKPPEQAIKAVTENLSKIAKLKLKLPKEVQPLLDEMIQKIQANLKSVKDIDSAKELIKEFRDSYKKVVEGMMESVGENPEAAAKVEKEMKKFTSVFDNAERLMKALDTIKPENITKVFQDPASVWKTLTKGLA